jgi:RimJ/RimL family protein N-acetyltransferase
MREEKYNAEEILEQIISIAHYEHDIAEFGYGVADVLYKQGYIDEAVYELLVGK